VLLRVMMGGARRPELVDLHDGELQSRARHDLAEAIGQDPEPRFVRILRHRRGIPQYTVGHLARLERAASRLALWPGLHLAGNAYRGIAVNDCVREAGPLATRVLRELGARLGTGGRVPSPPPASIGYEGPSP
jgi:protoporphyrinogen/coproporphyrinogen III oxidase